jgi:EAL domain-containing protein (putative c-di-GMP-specific phosphodiesterase class I)
MGLVRAVQDPELQIPDLTDYSLSPGRIVIELTESEPTFEWEPLLRAAEHFRSLGFAIALDDLGEGFASLKMWSALRPDYVKIDKYFVQGVSFDPVKHQFLRSIRELAVRMGAVTVAEGIETEADLAALLELGLDLGQGYLLGRPAPIPVVVPPPYLLLDESWITKQRCTS